MTSAFQDLTTASAQIKAGKLRALAVGGEKRRKALPDVPTMGELGYPALRSKAGSACSCPPPRQRRS